MAIVSQAYLYRHVLLITVSHILLLYKRSG